MKIKWGALVVDGRGKIGGQVASKNKSGAYMRNKVTPTNPQTTAQTSARQLFSGISQNWSALTEAQRDTWNEGVDSWGTTDVFGDLKNPTGKALYQRLNNQAQSAGLSALDTLPAHVAVGQGVVTAAVLDLSDVNITLTGANSELATTIMLFATAVLSDGTSFVKNRLRNIYNVNAASYSDTAAYTAYVNKFGVPAEGRNVYVGVVYVMATGQSSPMQIVKMTVQA
jgi:hypothetical protein